MENSKKDPKDLSVTSVVNIEVVRDDRRYVFSIPAGAPFGESFDAAFEALDIISGWYKKAQDKMKESRPQDDKKDKKD